MRVQKVRFSFLSHEFQSATAPFGKYKIKEEAEAESNKLLEQSAVASYESQSQSQSLPLESLLTRTNPSDSICQLEAVRLRSAGKAKKNHMRSI